MQSAEAGVVERCPPPTLFFLGRARCEKKNMNHDPRPSDVTDCSTDAMRRAHRFYWAGDMIEFLAHTAPRSSNAYFRALQPLIHEFCSNYVPDLSKVLGLRPATASERRLSRFGGGRLRFKQRRLRRYNETSHVMLLVELTGGRVSDTMLSASRRFPAFVELIDVKRVAAIRFLLWVAMELERAHGLGFEFVLVWTDVFIPFLLEGCDAGVRRCVRNDPWIRDSLR